ncbi:MAG: serine hydrolase, partial [Nitrosomonadaceae bacterium]
MKKIILALSVVFIFASGAFAQPSGLNLRSHSAFVFDTQQGRVIYRKKADSIMPIASITKLMTAMVVLDAKLSMTEKITIKLADVDRIKNTRSRLSVGSSLTRKEMLRLALMSSENRAAAALGRTYPGGTK